MLIFCCSSFFPRWQKAASYLSAGLVEPADLDGCIDCREVWRGGLVIREKKVRTSKTGVCGRNSQDTVLYALWTFSLLVWKDGRVAGERTIYSGRPAQQYVNVIVTNTQERMLVTQDSWGWLIRERKNKDFEECCVSVWVYNMCLPQQHDKAVCH